MTTVLLTEPTDETINFELHLLAEFWDQAPKVKILLDNILKYDSALELGMNVIKFKHTCKFNDSHKLTIDRYGKTNDQSVVRDNIHLDQKVILSKLSIDDVNVRNIMYTYGIWYPKYPEPWATKQKINGIILEEHIAGNTFFNHNGIWELEFTSPFYAFIMKWMGGGIR
jgi:hypothetical protein